MVRIVRGGGVDHGCVGGILLGWEDCQRPLYMNMGVMSLH